MNIPGDYAQNNDEEANSCWLGGQWAAVVCLVGTTSAADPPPAHASITRAQNHPSRAQKWRCINSVWWLPTQGGNLLPTSRPPSKRAPFAREHPSLALTPRPHSAPLLFFGADESVNTCRACSARTLVYTTIYGHTQVLDERHVCRGERVYRIHPNVSSSRACADRSGLRALPSDLGMSWQQNASCTSPKKNHSQVTLA